MSTASQQSHFYQAGTLSDVVAKLAFAASVATTCQMFEVTAASALLITLLAVACYYDLTSLRIPNWLTYPTAIIALSLNCILDTTATWVDSNLPAWLGTIGWSPSLSGFLTGFGSMLVVFALTGRGAGDVKLAAAIGAIVGPLAVVSIILWAHVLAASFATVWIVYQIGAWQCLRNVVRSLAHLVFPTQVSPSDWAAEELLRRPIPLAGFFAAGSFLVLGGIVQ